MDLLSMEWWTQRCDWWHEACWDVVRPDVTRYDMPVMDQRCSNASTEKFQMSREIFDPGKECCIL
jgi:hypothetical protein